LCLLVAACSAGNDGTSPTESARTQAASTGTIGVAIEFRSTPDPPEAGSNAFEVTVRRPNGSLVPDANVTAVFSMPAMPSMNMPAMRSEAPLTPVGDGRYRGAGELSMGGTWNVSITATENGKQIGVRKFSVVATK
jgi:nitrogen fixation protein FixH